MVSIKDIAKKCNVSVATVSKALNDKDDLSLAMKQKVRKAAAEMGYAVNVSARALKTNRTYNLGVLFADDRAGFAHEYFSLILESFQREAESAGYDITFINRKIAGQETTYLKHGEYRHLDGVVIMTADFNNEEIIELASSSLPVVVIDHIYKNVATVLSDNTIGMDEIVRYAYEMGHRKIAYIYGDPTEVTVDRLGSFRRTCARLGLNIPEKYIVQSGYHDIRNCYETTKKVLELEDRPTLIIFPDDYSYVGGLEAIGEKGLAIPGDISAIGYDGINMAKIMKLTTYEQNTAALGRTAAKKLIAMIDDPETPRDITTVTGELLIGRTVKDLNQ